MTPKTHPENSFSTYKVFAAIVSHNDDADITEVLRPHSWCRNSTRIIPIILSNVPSARLRTYCQKHRLEYIENKVQAGFGANNNRVFSYLQAQGQLSNNDLFFCINPDIETSADSLLQIGETMKSTGIKLAAPNLLGPDGKPEDNVREFPRFLQTVSRLLTNNRSTTIDKRKIVEKTRVEWASGAFLCFEAGLFSTLRGYDEGFYMYYEDADICRRALTHKTPTYYLPNVIAVHNASRQSRSIFSRQFIWHIASALRFFATSGGRQIVSSIERNSSETS